VCQQNFYAEQQQYDDDKQQLSQQQLLQQSSRQQQQHWAGGGSCADGAAAPTAISRPRAGHSGERAHNVANSLRRDFFRPIFSLKVYLRNNMQPRIVTSCQRRKKTVKQFCLNQNI
jgi:hypothetical protein